jgi:hypothetical protein
LLAEATPLSLSRLLALFPVNALREKWHEQRKKADILAWATQNASQKEIKQFLDEYFGNCKQHIYLFTHRSDVTDLPNFRLPDAEKISERSDDNVRQFLYLAEVEFHVVYTNPLGEDRIKFLWPIRLEFVGNILIVRFVMMEKDVRTYFGEGVSRTVGRSLTEPQINAHLKNVLAELEVLDINRGIKHLWNQDRIDGTKIRYRKAKSMSTESMDAGAGVKRTYPDLYKELVKRPLFDSTFKTLEEDENEEMTFRADPSNGYLGLSSYADDGDGRNSFVSEIIRHN